MMMATGFSAVIEREFKDLKAQRVEELLHC